MKRDAYVGDEAKSFSSLLCNEISIDETNDECIAGVSILDSYGEILGLKYITTKGDTGAIG